MCVCTRQNNHYIIIGFSPTAGKRHTATSAWTDTLRRTGVGITAETGKQNMESFSGLSKSQMKSMGYSSTSHYLRQKAGTERPPRQGGGNTRESTE